VSTSMSTLLTSVSLTHRHADPGRREMNTSSVSANRALLWEMLSPVLGGAMGVVITSLSVGLLVESLLTLSPYIGGSDSFAVEQRGSPEVSSDERGAGAIWRLGGARRYFAPEDSDIRSDSHAHVKIVGRDFVISEEHCWPYLCAQLDSNLHQSRYLLHAVLPCGTGIRSSGRLHEGHGR